MTARERVLKLFDAGTFVEIGEYVKKENIGFDKNSNASLGLITGYGQINGRLTYVVAEDANAYNGAFGEMHANKIINCENLAMKVGAPIITMFDSKGVLLEEGIDILSFYGKVFKHRIKLKGLVPEIAVITGVCAGADTLVANMSDFVFMIDGVSHMFMTSDNLIRANEGIVNNDYGLAKTHSEITGAIHFKCLNDDDCLNKIKELLSYLPQNSMEMSEEIMTSDDLNRLCPMLNDISNNGGSFDVKNVIREISDGNVFFEVKEDFAKNIVTGFIRLGGKVVGVVANNSYVDEGIVTVAASNKASNFIKTCNLLNIPILTLVDTIGFGNTLAEEQGGIIKEGANFAYEYAKSNVPMVTVILHKAYGSASVAMCSKNIGADLVYAWDKAEIGLMNAKGIVNIIYADEIKKADNPDKERQSKINEYKEKYLSPYYAASRMFVDSVIEPQMTRKLLIAAFDTLSTKVLGSEL